MLSSLVRMVIAFVVPFVVEAQDAPKSPPAENKPRSAQPPSPVPVKESSEARRERLLANAVYTLTISYGTDTVANGGLKSTRVQTAFCVDDGGLAISNYAALHTATSIVAKSKPDKSARKVEVLGADPELDLALLRIAPTTTFQAMSAGAAKPGASAGASTTPPSNEPAKPAAPAPPLSNFLEIGAPCTLETTPTWTLVPALVDRGPECVDNGQLMKRDEESGAWVRNNGARDRYLPGAPIVDKASRVVGVWRWAWSGEPPGTVSSAEIAKLVERHRSDPALNVKERAEKYGEAKRRSLAFPVLRLEKVEEAGEASRWVNGFADDIDCDECKGTGRELRIEKEGPNMRDVTPRIPCARCSGSGLEKPSAIEKKLYELAAKLARSPRDPASKRKNIEALDAALAKVMTKHPKSCIPALSEAQSDRAEPVTLLPGRTIALVLSPGEWREQVETTDFELIRSLTSTRLGPLILVDPQYGNPNDGSPVLLLGTVAGYVTLNKLDCLVIERPYAVTLH